MAGDLFQELKRRNIFKAAIAYVIAGWLLMQFVQAIFPALNLPATWIDIVFALLFVGFPFLILFVWMYEITPKGLRRQEDVIPGKSIAYKTGRKIDIMIVVLLVFALLVTAAQFSTRFAMQEIKDVPSASIGDATTDDERLTNLPRTSLGSDKSIAVLPFKNMSPDPENEYFSDGISEELINRLVKIDGLRVPSRTSSFSFKGENVDLDVIGERLNVDHVLEGSVRKSGNRVRITAQLIDISSDANLWTESYDRALTDIFEIQAEIALQIVESLKVALNTGITPVAELANDVPTQNIEAYEFYLQGRHLWYQRGEDNLRKAIGLFEQAIELDPAFAEGYMGLASTWNVLASWSGVPQRTYNPKAREQAQKALAIDNTLDEAYAVLAGVAQGDQNWVQAERHYNHALSLNRSNPFSHIWFAESLMRAGRTREAVELSRTAYNLDPLSIPVNDILSAAYLANGMFDDAIHHANISRELGGPSQPADWMVAYFNGDYDHAAFAWEQLLAGFHFEPLPVREVFAAIKDSSKHDAAIRALAAAEQREGTDPHQIFNLYYILGEEDKAYAVIDDMNSTTFPLIFVWLPQNSELRKSENFKNIARNTGLIEFWKASEWADSCRPAGDDFECS